MAEIHVSRWGHCTSRSAMTVLEGRVARGGCLARLPLLCSFFRQCENQPLAVQVFGTCVY